MASATAPTANPKTMPPPASSANRPRTEPALASDSPVANPSSTMKTTTPVPSLNRLSPVMRDSSFFEAPTSFRMPSTAIGSVGEIKAPNSRQWIGDRPRPASEDRP